MEFFVFAITPRKLSAFSTWSFLFLRFSLVNFTPFLHGVFDFSHFPMYDSAPFYMGFFVFAIFPRKLSAFSTWGFSFLRFPLVNFTPFLHGVFDFSHFPHVNIRMDLHLDICTCATSYASDSKPCEASALNELRSNEFSTATP